jgi:hypothetical protein
LRLARAYKNLVIEESFFYGQGKVENNKRTTGKDRTIIAKTQKIKERRQSLGGLFVTKTICTNLSFCHLFNLERMANLSKSLGNK